jgi:hypothetical protein
LKPQSARRIGHSVEKLKVLSHKVKVRKRSLIALTPNDLRSRGWRYLILNFVLSSRAAGIHPAKSGTQTY